MADSPEAARRPWWQRWQWLLALLPIVYAGARVLVVSEGDVQTMKSLVLDLDVTALVLATVLPISSTFALWLFFGWSLHRLNPFLKSPRHAGDALNFIGPLLLPGAVVVALVTLGMPRGYLVGNASAIGALALLVFVGRRMGTKQQLVTIILLSLGILFGLAMLSASSVLGFGQRTWLPHETVTVLGESPITGSVLSSDPRWTRVLSDDGQLSTVASARVLTRTPIPDTPSRWEQPWITPSSGTLTVAAVVAAVMVGITLAMVIAGLVVELTKTRANPDTGQNGVG